MNCILQNFTTSTIRPGGRAHLSRVTYGGIVSAVLPFEEMPDSFCHKEWGLAVPTQIGSFLDGDSGVPALSLLLWKLSLLLYNVPDRWGTCLYNNCLHNA